jgi:hypothetical protein
MIMIITVQRTNPCPTHPALRNRVRQDVGILKGPPCATWERKYRYSVPHPMVVLGRGMMDVTNKPPVKTLTSDYSLEALPHSHFTQASRRVSGPERAWPHYLRAH